MRNKIVSTLIVNTIFSLSVWAAPRIEISSNGVISPEEIQDIVKLQVVEFDFSQYPGLIKQKGKWQKLLKKLHLQDASLIPVEDEVEKILFMNTPLNAHTTLNLRRMPKEKMILFMWEPPLRHKRMYASKTQQCFSRIYTWDDDLVDNQTYFKFYYPALSPMIEERPPFAEKKFCTLVSGYDGEKFGAPFELYSEREKAISFFEAKGEAGFAFYGKGWDPQKHPSYLGPIEDKIEVIKYYRFAICYENSYGLNGYITEKIFDCFHAGVIPVYWGAENVEKYIPKNCFIDRRNFASLEDLYTFLKKISEKEYENYIKEIDAFLKSEKAQLFSHAHFNQLLRELMK